MCSLLAASAHAQAGAQKVALDPSGQPVFEFSEDVALSNDGRYIAFVCFDSTLAPGEANGKEDVFVRDRVLGVTQRVAPFANRGVFEPAIAGNGRFVSVTSTSTNLVPKETFDHSQVYLYDLELGTTKLVSVATTSEGGDAQSSGGFVSDDGRWVSFFSYATDLVAGDFNQVADIFLRDTVGNFTELITIGPGGEYTDQHSYLSAMTPDARFVVFETRSTTIEAQPNNYRDLFIRDRVLATTEQVTFDYNGNATNGRSEGPIDISDDGRFISFTSEADDLVPGQHDDPFPVRAVFVRDRLLGTTEIISVDPTVPGMPELGDCFDASMTADGRYVVFSCADTGAVYLRDRVVGSLFRIDYSDFGVAGNGTSDGAVISDDGQWIGFTSDASTLVPGDVNENRDAYVRPWARIGDVSVQSLVGGTQASVTFSGLGPSSFMLVGVSVQSAGPLYYSLLGLSGLSDLGSLDLFMTGWTDGTGQLSLSAALPLAMVGTPIHIQALDLFTGGLTPAFNGFVQ